MENLIFEISLKKHDRWEDWILSVNLFKRISFKVVFDERLLRKLHLVELFKQEKQKAILRCLRRMIPQSVEGCNCSVCVSRRSRSSDPRPKGITPESRAMVERFMRG